MLRSLSEALRSSLSALGPQQSYVALRPERLSQDEEQDDDAFVDGRDASLWTMKSLHSIRSIELSNPLLSLVVDAVESFHAQHGTGTSTLLGWLIFLLEFVQKASGREELDLRLASLEEFERLYVAVAHAVSLDMDTLSDSTRYDREAADVDDTSWFFLSPSLQEDSDRDADAAILKTVLASQDLLLQGQAAVSSSKEKELEWEERRIVRALQHSLLSDYPAESVADGLCPPANLAWQAVQSLRGLIGTACSDAKKLAAGLDCVCADDGHDNENDDDEDEEEVTAKGFWGLSACFQLRHCVSVTLAPGYSHCRSFTQTNCVLFLTPEADLHSLVRPGLQSRMRPGSVLCVDGSALYGSSGGASGAAVGLSVTKIQHSHDLLLRGAELFDPLNPRSLQFSPLALQRNLLLRRLSALGVKLVLAPSEAVCTEAVDLLRQGGIALVATPRAVLEQAAAVSGCEIVGEALEAIAGHCSRFCVDFAALDCTRSPSMCLAKLSRHTHSHSHSHADADGDGDGDKNEDSKDDLFEDCAESSVVGVGVLICAPTLAQARSLRDRFWRSGERLVLAVGGSPLVPSGLVEALCLASIDRMHDKARMMGLGEVLYMVVSAAANNAFGLSHAESHVELERSSSALRKQLLGQGAQNCGDDDGLFFLQRLAAASHSQNTHSRRQKILALWALAPAMARAAGPEAVADGGREALDLTMIRIGALKAAISTVKLLSAFALKI